MAVVNDLFYLTARSDRSVLCSLCPLRPAAAANQAGAHLAVKAKIANRKPEAGSRKQGRFV